ncbi:MULTISPECIES: hypothetical protein [Kaistia]|uniref:Uncharacterized protein n=1 Tax=Kaistia nematophila TaxID=2994654 RepID=A0A9X3EBM9_9HYPH|nr:hypothetical protein [Kaistia nematophila]MBN9059288.1 hypothetical protein [Hyphomicrobiales bacterium]MCX5569860.1 hypothetical protein [Kaistia nematophila]
MSDKTEAELDTDFDEFEGDHYQVTITVDVIASNPTEAAMLAYWSLNDELPDTFEVKNAEGESEEVTLTDEQKQEALADEIELDVL